ncbi:type I secretion system permease/ATPase [Marivivens sp. LCG002]|uniref:type I secretion system permease/ATPase n=1 Tax=Marivivens sp. LCG002 TaxID=3051171 RepID=UPI002553A969|nr:type I secretion system permease/ATPase [Marivivens sp. LCG002]WIV50973.1 type I secretion system permease/ATPase [Marivivens sp. LCG002]
MSAGTQVQATTIKGKRILMATMRKNSALIWSAALFSLVVNVLMLSGPLYMLSVYDRVLGSRSVETLVALSIIVGFLYLCMTLLDYVRGRIMARVGARFQSALDPVVFRTVQEQALLRGNSGSGGLRDLEAVQRALTSPAVVSAFDLPWMPVFFVGIFIFHPWLGWLSVGGAALLMVLAILNQSRTRDTASQAAETTARAERYNQTLQESAEQIRSLGMTTATMGRWAKMRNASLGSTMTFSDTSGLYAAGSRGARLMLQSAMLGLGAFLVLRGEMTAGAMIAGSILLGRALAPIELLIAQWALIERAIDGWGNLTRLLSVSREMPERTPLPAPEARLSVSQLTIVPPGQATPTLRMLSFELSQGQALGVIGPSGAGKTTLAKALVGTWTPTGGTIRLDRATLDQYDPEVLGQYVGYLPQRIQLFDGSITENIARMSETPDTGKVVAAAQMAAAHDMILKLPNGYDTQINATGGSLSGGQIQRIGLARALYNDPVIVILDEPNSNLDNEGSMALNAAIRSLKASGKAVIIMAHRPAAIQECDLLLVIEDGLRRGFGPRDDVLKQMVQNHQTIQQDSTGGGVR